MDHNKKDWGEELYDQVRTAIDKMDFEGFSQSVFETLHTTGNLIGDVAGQFGNQMGEAAGQAGRQISGAMKDAGRSISEEISNQTKGMKERICRKNISGRFRTVPGKYLANVEKIAGMAGMGFTGFALMIILATGLSMGMEAVLPMIICLYLPLFLLFTVLYVHGNKAKKRAIRLKIYQDCWLGLPFIMADQLSEKTGIPLKTVKEDFRYITEQHLLLYGVLDESGTCLLLTPEATAQYEMAIMSKRQREAEELQKQTQKSDSGIWRKKKDDMLNPEKSMDDQTARSQEEAAKNQEPEDPVERHYTAFCETSQNQETELNLLRNQLHNPVMKEKVYDFLQNYCKILSLVDEKHELSLHLDRLKDYYIPSVIKLLTVYQDLENKPMETENILKSKQEISRSIDMMNEALLKMYDDLFQSTAMDVNADVKVMEMLLKKDGFLS